MKKNIIIIVSVVVVIIALICGIILFSSQNEIKDTTTINKIVEDSNLELILNLKNFTKEDFSESNLLEVSMQMADKLGYKNETTEGDYVEYVNPSELHEIIKDLVGIDVEAPIQIEGSIYRYDSENEYYYYVPLAEVSFYQIESIDHLYKNDNTYTIECTATKSEGGEYTEEDTIITKLQYNPENIYTKYQVISQEVR